MVKNKAITKIVRGCFFRFWYGDLFEGKYCTTDTAGDVAVFENRQPVTAAELRYKR